MEIKSVRCLTNSISQTSKPIPNQKDFETLAILMKHLKPVLDEIVDDLVPMDEALLKECEELDAALNEARAFLERWSAKASQILSVLQKAKLTQEHAVTTLLNLSLNDEIKATIAEAGTIDPLIHVLKTGNDAARENSAAALFSLSLLEEYKVKIGHSGAVKLLVDHLGSGTIRGKKDAATALFNLSICHENKARIVQAGAVKYLVELLDPSSGMVEKVVALLSNLSTIAEGRAVVAQEGGTPSIVEIVESGSQRGKENAALVLLQMCLNSNKFCCMVLKEGAVPPLVTLSQSGTPRAKEKAQQLLSHFRTQREGSLGKKKSSK